ncbi:MAG: exodeoxyribonuclease VII small subunit [Candidatus Paceibacterota bacterium]
MSDEKFDFSEAYQEIKEINKWFEKEEIDLEEALDKYEKGMKLIKKCKDRLEESENKFKEIKEEYSEEVKED